MAWITTEDGRRVNTEWFDDDERRKYAQIEENQKQADKLNGKEIIERNEEGEILVKCSVTDIRTGKRKVGFEFSSSSRKQAREDLKSNGYRVTPRTLLPRKLFDKVMNETNGNDWDWDDAQKEFNTLLKRGN